MKMLMFLILFLGSLSAHAGQIMASQNLIRDQALGPEMTLKDVFFSSEKDFNSKLDRLGCKSFALNTVGGEALNREQRLKLELNAAMSTEQVQFELAKDAMQTSTISKVTAISSLLPLVAATGIGLFNYADDLGVVSSAQESIVGVAGVTVVGGGFLADAAWANSYGNSSSADRVNAETSAVNVPLIVQRLSAAQCDLSGVHSEIANLRTQVYREMDSRFYWLRNGLSFGMKSARITSQLYALALLDRMTFQIQLYQSQSRPDQSEQSQ